MPTILEPRSGFNFILINPFYFRDGNTKLEWIVWELLIFLSCEARTQRVGNLLLLVLFDSISKKRSFSKFAMMFPFF
jgi:hypothetical protein